MLAIGNEKWDVRNGNSEMGNRKWEIRTRESEMGNEKLEIRILNAQIPFLIWLFEVKKLNWALRNGKWD